MCLTINKTFHSKGKSLKAEQSILVYKVLERDGKHYQTPYEYMPINFDDEYGMFFYKTIRLSFLFQRINNFTFYSNSISEINYKVEKGIHSYTTLDEAKDCVENLNECFSSNASLHYAIIPKGSKFFIGSNGDIVSTNLVVFKRKKDYDKNKKLFGRTYELGRYLMDFWHEDCNKK